MENMSVNLTFRARQGEEKPFVLHDPNLESSRDLHDAFAAVFDAVAKTLSFEISVAEPLPAVIPPIRRSWNEDETALVDETIAQAGDTLHVRWMPDGIWHAEWLSRRNQEDVLIGQASSETTADYERNTFVRSHDRPAIEIDELTVAYIEHPQPSLDVSGRLRFVACPLPMMRPIRVRVHTEVREAALRQGVFRARFPIPQGEPETIELVFLAGGDPPSVTSGVLTRRIPTSLTGAEISVDELSFSERLFAGKVPKRIRFRAVGYAPRLITLEFRPTAGDAAPSTVLARKVDHTVTHVEYVLELDNNSKLSFSQSVPGTMLVAVVGQNDTPTVIELVPHLVRAVWEQLDAEIQLRIVSGELNLGAILGLGSIFDARTPAPHPASSKTGRFGDPSRVVTNVLLAGGLSIPLDDRAFTPAFARDATKLWNRAFTLETSAGTSVRLGQGIPELKEWWEQVLTARKGEAVVLSLPGGTQALLALPGNRKFGPRITDAFSCVGQSFGVCFRGFCLEAKILRLRPSLSDGGLLLKPLKPLHLDNRTRPLVSPFLPLRVIRAVDGDALAALAFWEPAAAPVIVPIERSLPIHERIGYIYKSGEDLFWSRFPEADSFCALQYMTFDGLAFSDKNGAVDFEGWWLPNGRGEFQASEPFHSYRFDFTEGAGAPYGFELKDGNVRCTEQGRWLSPEALQELQDAIKQLKEAKSGKPLRIDGHYIEVRWSQRDAQKTFLVTASKVVDSLEVGLYALA